MSPVETRAADILAAAVYAPTDDPLPGVRATTVDTSCAHVPRGFLHLARTRLGGGESPDAFWAACIARDRCVDPLTAYLEPVSNAVLAMAAEDMRRELERVGKSGAVELPGAACAAFELAGGCADCWGRVLLVQSADDATYLHWHRES